MVNPTYFFTGLIRCECCGNVYTRKKSKLRGKIYVQWICRTKKEVGRTCSSDNFHETDLLKICKSVVGDDYESRIKGISVDTSGDIHFRLTGDEERIWKNLHLNPAKHPHTVTDAFLRKVICGKCGTIYHRVNAHNRWCYWKCYGKQKHICDNVNYTDYQIRTISAYMMNTPVFNEDAFAEQIQEIRVLDGGSLKFIYKDGSEKIWERL